MTIQQREIPRQPIPPTLSDQLIRLLTDLCFRLDDKLTPADLLFVFGNNQTSKMAERVRSILDGGFVTKVILTGGKPDFGDDGVVVRAESELVLESIKPELFPGVDFFLETVSTNTRANVIEALKVLDFSHYQKIIFLFKRHDSRRGYLTLKKILPQTEILQTSFAGVYPGGITITDNNWFENDFAISRVWGEYLRIKTFGRRGDIAFDEVADIVEAIEKLTE